MANVEKAGPDVERAALGMRTAADRRDELSQRAQRLVALAAGAKTGLDVWRAGQDAHASAKLHWALEGDRARIRAILASFGITGRRRNILSAIDRESYGDRADARGFAVNVDPGDRATLVALGRAMAAAGDPVDEVGGWTYTATPARGGIVVRVDVPGDEGGTWWTQIVSRQELRDLQRVAGSLDADRSLLALYVRPALERSRGRLVTFPAARCTLTERKA